MTLVVGGCARRDQVIIDPSGVDMAQYQRDLAECRQIAAQVNSKAGGGVVAGAVVGALIGAAVGNSDTAKKAAGVGAVSGGAKGTVATAVERKRVLKNCMRVRGYRVLN
jgi:uncharacterized protein YcfJ